MKKIPARISDLLFITKSFLLQFVVLKDGSIYTRIDSRTLKIHHPFIWPVCQYSRRSESAIMANRFERLAKPDESVCPDKSRLFLFPDLWISKKHGLFFSLVKAVNHVQSFRFASYVSGFGPRSNCSPRFEADVFLRAITSVSEATSESVSY